MGKEKRTRGRRNNVKKNPKNESADGDESKPTTVREKRRDMAIASHTCTQGICRGRTQTHFFCSSASSFLLVVSITLLVLLRLLSSVPV